MMKSTVKSVLIFAVLLNMVACKTVDKNILIYNNQENFKPCEPSICIDPTDEKIIVAGSILNNVHRSTDGGKTWTSTVLKSSHGVYGDPVIAADDDGSFYYCHLGDPDKKGWASERLLESIVVQRSDDHGITWNDGAAVGANPPKDQDKEWLAADPYSDHIYMTWTEFDVYGSKDPKDKTRILFSSSSDKGNTWTKPQSISSREGNCLDDDDTVEGAVPAAGKNGHVYVAWSGFENIYFNKSTDRGKTWLPKEKAIAKQHGGWVLPIKGLKRVNGFPVTQVDHSGSKYDGRIYVLYAEQKESVSNTDIKIVYSDDEGGTWSQPVRVNKDDGKEHQFFPWLAVDQSSGILYAVYYNRKNYSDLRNDVTMATSYDGGVTWEERVISEKPFHTPPEFVFFGDYNNISAVNGQIRPIWTRYDEGKLSIWTALIKEPKRNKKRLVKP